MPWFVWHQCTDNTSRVHQLAISLEQEQTRVPLNLLAKIFAACLHFTRGTRELLIVWWRQKSACQIGYGTTSWRQLRHLFIAVFRYNFPPIQYYRTRLFRLERSRWSSIFSHIETTLILATFEKNIPAPHDPWSKSGWATFCALKGLPTIPTAAEAIHGQLQLHHPEMLEAGRDLFIKPDIDYSSLGGIMLIWDHAFDGWQCHGANNSTIPRDGLLHFLSTHSQDSHLVVQPRMQNVKSLTDITKNSLVNVRIVTIKCPIEGYSILSACLRFPPHDEVTSDVVGSTWMAPIDIESGRLGPAESVHLEYGPCAHHPHNQSRIEDRVIPDWHAMCDLALSVHKLLPDMPTIGWDFVNTESGVYILEANGVWNAHMIQQLGVAPLGETSWPQTILSATEAIVRP